jgi:hypothetical protein
VGLEPTTYALKGLQGPIKSIGYIQNPGLKPLAHGTPEHEKGTAYPQIGQEVILLTLFRYFSNIVDTVNGSGIA